jgi:Thylakoid formation protein
VGKDVRTVGEAFTAFTEELGFTVNALYKGMITDIVGSTHLILVNARFQRDPVWSLGMLTALDLLLKNYPEKGMPEKITTALFKSVGLDEKALRADAKMIEEWAQGKTKEEIEAALSAADPSNPLGAVAAKVKADEFWMYSRYFGIGLVKLMEIAGVEMDKDEVYPVMENWMSTQLGKSHLSACVSATISRRNQAIVDPSAG